jgi:hypothetical protein
MTREGTVVNGVIVPDGSMPPLPEGTRVRVWLVEDAEDDGVVAPHVRHAAQDRLSADDF